MVVYEISQQGKEIRDALYFVDDDQPSEILERKLRLLKPGHISGVFQIKVVIKIKFTGNGRFTTLPGTHDCSDWK